MEVWKEGGNAKGREGEDRSRTSTRELTLSRSLSLRANGPDRALSTGVVVEVRLAGRRILDHYR